jgi:hypothetical protein
MVGCKSKANYGRRRIPNWTLSNHSISKERRAAAQRLAQRRCAIPAQGQLVVVTTSFTPPAPEVQS